MQGLRLGRGLELLLASGQEPSAHCGTSLGTGLARVPLCLGRGWGSGQIRVPMDQCTSAGLWESCAPRSDRLGLELREATQVGLGLH